MPLYRPYITHKRYMDDTRDKKTMTLKYLKFMKKWVIIYKGKARSVGNTPAEAIDEAMNLLRLKIIK